MNVWLNFSSSAFRLSISLLTSACFFCVKRCLSFVTKSRNAGNGSAGGYHQPQQRSDRQQPINLNQSNAVAQQSESKQTDQDRKGLHTLLEADDVDGAGEGDLTARGAVSFAATGVPSGPLTDTLGTSFGGGLVPEAGPVACSLRAPGGT